MDRELGIGSAAAALPDDQWSGFLDRLKDIDKRIGYAATDAISRERLVEHNMQMLALVTGKGRRAAAHAGEPAIAWPVQAEQDKRL